MQAKPALKLMKLLNEDIGKNIQLDTALSPVKEKESILFCFTQPSLPYSKPKLFRVVEKDTIRLLSSGATALFESVHSLEKLYQTDLNTTDIMRSAR